MKAEKTIVCRVTDPNKGKLGALKKEYEKVQQYVHGDKGVDLYSATQQALDSYIDWDSVKSGKEYPWFLRNDTFQVEESRDTKHFDYWARIPVADVRGGVVVPIIPHEEIGEDYEVHDSKIVRKPYGFELHLSVSREVEPVPPYDGVLGVDLGLRKLAVSVSLPDRQTRCHTTNIGEIQAKYYFLRRHCENGYVRSKWDGKMENKVDDILHKVSKRIVDRAKRNNLLIVLGNLDGVQEEDKGRVWNRRLHNFPHWKLRRYIRYKARWEGVLVVEVSEAYTSQRCSRCGELGNKHKGRFGCPNCGLEVDRDKNGAHNIGVRGVGKFAKTSPYARSLVAGLEASTNDGTSVYQVPKVAGNLRKRSDAPSSRASAS